MSPHSLTETVAALRQLNPRSSVLRFFALPQTPSSLERDIAMTQEPSPMSDLNLVPLCLSPRQTLRDLQDLADERGYIGIRYDAIRRVFYGVERTETTPLLRERAEHAS